MEEYITGFRGVDKQPPDYRLRDDWISPVVASDPTHHNNVSKYFTHDEGIISYGSILGWPAVLGSDLEAFRPFTDSFITDRALI